MPARACFGICRPRACQDLPGERARHVDAELHELRDRAAAAPNRRPEHAHERPGEAVPAHAAERVSAYLTNFKSIETPIPWTAFQQRFLQMASHFQLQSYVLRERAYSKRIMECQE